ncbi:MAG: hypothetical protein NC081_01035 [Roseburia sp.]|nr:hypothetical protein [Roseburia sp.]
MKDALVTWLKRVMVILPISALAGTLLLTLAFCIPTKPMFRKAAVSLDDMIRSAEDMEEGSFSRYLWGHKETYTDAIMVQNAIESREERNAFEEAMWVYHSDLNPDFWTPEESLKAYCTQTWEGEVYTYTYARYWHGYLIYLKPLMLLFSWKQLVILGAVLQLMMLAAVVILAVKKRQAGIGIALLAGFFYMKPIIVMASLTMAVCNVIMLGALLVILSRHDWLKENGRYAILFLLIGILTAYFDFLTYPIVTLGFPLCAYFLMEEGERMGGSLKKLTGYSISWGVGYAGMWALKWVIADITLHTGTIKDALWSILGRTEVIGGRPRLNGGFYTISLNLQEYDSAVYGIGAVLLGIAALAAVIVAVRKVGVKPVLARVFLFAIVFCIPFVWIIVVQHHSALHARFTFRIISIAAMALCCISIGAVRQCRKADA